MSQNENPYQPPQSSLSVEYEQKKSLPRPRKAGPFFRTFAGVIGALFLINGFARFSIDLVGLAASFAMFAFGVQFIVAGVTGYWYTWTGRRQD